MRMLGIDPGFGILGWAVIDDAFAVVDYGTIETPSGMPLDERLFTIFTSLTDIVRRYRPDYAAIEKLYFARNTTTAFDVARATGIVLLVLHQHALPWCEFTPSQVKQAMTGSGRADKPQMQFMVQKIFRLKECPRPDDAADALAIAACGLMQQPRPKKSAPL
jgi:crossover junction endodeoxyribonuclease RuvC